MLELPDRSCTRDGCKKHIPKSKNITAMYCSKICQTKAANLRAKIKKNLDAPQLETTAHESASIRKGTTYTKLVDAGYAQMIVDGSMTASHAAELLAVTPAGVTRAMGAYRVSLKLDEQAEAWEMDPDHARLLPVAGIAKLRKWGPGKEGTRKYDKLFDKVCEAFWDFEHRYFTIGSRGGTFIRKPFHTEILRALVHTYVHGTKVLILTPPRHGKSEVILRFVAWIMVLEPNIQVLWVASNSKLAAIMTRKLKGVFRYNKMMNDELLPPGQKFADQHCPKWTEDEFILYTRTDHTLKSSTFTALGSDATVAGRDVDFAGIDDLEERKTVATSDLRQKSREKHAEIMERKEEHTGVVTIASRQHLDDIPNHLMAETDPDLAWRTLVYPAHDDDCDLDPDIMASHVDCMLMPEVRSYKWLMQMMKESEDLGLPGRFPLRYLQKPVPVEGIVFDIPLIKEVCLDRSRGLGLPEGVTGKLISGLDPAARGTQAAFCWMWTEETVFMVDLDTHKAGGFQGALDVMEKYEEKYNLKDWVYEDNSQKIEFFRDPRLITLKDDLDLNVMKHTTGQNKHDPELGLTAMAPWYHSGRINLPYGTAEARRKVNILLRQLELWTTDGFTKKGKSDIKMASWFPFPRMQRWHRSASEVELVLESNQSYPGYGDMNAAPWGYTAYPGG